MRRRRRAWMGTRKMEDERASKSEERGGKERK